MKKAFSLIEIIFVMAILALISSIAVPKLQKSLNKSDFVKIKADVALIKEALNKYKNQMILSSLNEPLISLEEDNGLLFSKILKYPILASNDQKAGTWSKISNGIYEVTIDANTKLKFVYDYENFSFECDFEDENCKKVTLSY